MSQPKYTCVNCESDKEPYFSRSEPMGFYCSDCGRNFDERNLQDAKATAEFWMNRANQAEQAADDLKSEVADWKNEYSAERALADRLAGDLNDLWHHYSQTEDSYEVIEAALAAWKEARND